MNARSVLNNFKLDELRLFVALNNIHVIGIAESWLHDNISNIQVSIDNLTLYRKDRSAVKSGRGGGVLLYIHSL